jgi:histidinol-phosphatase (PHP family)
MDSPFPYNYHSHTHFCDGTKAPENYVIASIEKSYKSYGFSSHAPIPGGSVWNMKEEDLQEYISIIQLLKENYKNDLEIYLSMEVDYLADIQGPSKYSDILDYTLGSVHFIGYGPLEKRFEMDGPYTKFLAGLEEHYQNKIVKATEHYFQLNWDMIQNDPPDVIGHIDKIVSHILKYDMEILNSDWYTDLLLETAQILENSNVILELNTRGLQSSKYPTTYPHDDFLKILSNHKIKFQMNADVHKTTDLDMGYKQTLEILRGLKINELWVREKNQWAAKSIIEA